jgi:hypothetical protein
MSAGLSDSESKRLQLILRELDRRDEQLAKKAESLKSYRQDIAKLEELIRLSARIRELL